MLMISTNSPIDNRTGGLRSSVETTFIPNFLPELLALGPHGWTIPRTGPI